MKRLSAIFFIRIFAMVITFNIAFAFIPVKIFAQQTEVDFQKFYDQLNPYGQWVEDLNYGYIWIPIAGPDFTPYLSNGYWIFTDYGWMWHSNYEWGWVAFHYGRWDFNGSYGWFWVPDNVWGPSWVSWRRSNGYYGWAPMRPGVSVGVTFGKGNDMPNNRWIFIRDSDIDKHDISKNHINQKNNLKIISSSTVITNTFYNVKRRTTYVAGPAIEDIQKNTGRKINMVSVQEKENPGQSLKDGKLQVFMPKVRKNDSRVKLVPLVVTISKNVKRISEQSNKKQPGNDLSQNSRTKNEQQTSSNIKLLDTKIINRSKNIIIDQPSNSIRNIEKKESREK